MSTTSLRRNFEVNPLAEVSLLQPKHLDRWRGFPVGWVRATPELVGRCCDNEDALLLAMLDTGHARADFHFGSRVSRHALGRDDIGLFSPRTHADFSHWRCENVQRIMLRIERQQLADEPLAEQLFDVPPPNDLAFRDPALSAVLRAMVNEVAAGCPNGALYAESLSVGVALHLQRRAPARRPAERGRLGMAQLARLQEWVREHLDQGVSIQQMAEVVGMSRSLFLRRFKASEGCSPYQFVLQQRLLAAREQIAQDEVPLAEVAQRLGFSSQSHMTTQFVRRYGCTPGELRRGHRS